MTAYFFLILLLALAGGAVVFFNALYYRKKDDNSHESHEFKLKNVKPGSFFVIKGLSDDLNDCHVLVTAKHSVQMNEHRWLRIEGKLNQVDIAIDCPDDEFDGTDTAIAVYLKKIDVSELSVDYDLLKQMETQEETNLVFEGFTYRLWLAGDTVYEKNCEHQNTVRYRSWVFNSSSNKYRLFVERKKDMHRTVYLGKILPQSRVEIFRMAPSI